MNSMFVTAAPTEDIRGPIDPVQQWLVTPAQREDFAHIYAMLTRVLELDEDDADALREDYLRLQHFCAVNSLSSNTGVVDTAQLDAETLKALLHQRLCGLLRAAASMIPCEQPCCCHCVNAPDDIACIYRYTLSHGGGDHRHHHEPSDHPLRRGRRGRRKGRQCN